jgi:hypothetical protein
MSFTKNKDVLLLQEAERKVCETNMKEKRAQALLNIPSDRITPISPYPTYTRFQLDMRRKVEILKYENNATNTKTNNFTKKQQWSMLVNGYTKNGSQASIERELSNNGNPNPCPQDEFLPTLSSASDVPGKVIVLQYVPNVPLYNYVSNEAFAQNDGNTSRLEIKKKETLSS